MKDLNCPSSIAVVIPCFRAASTIVEVIRRIGPEVQFIFVIDDGCPEQSGEVVSSRISDSRIRVIYHGQNRGVGAAVKTGFREAIKEGASVIVKIDGDGQMAPERISVFVDPILSCSADYTKGNRLFEVETFQKMPALRLVGNIILTFLTKLSSGYWNISDPTCGFIAIDAKVASKLPLGKISNGYFFESDILFRLNLLRAVVLDVPADAIYSNEVSSLSIRQEAFRFLKGNFENLLKRLVYNYFLRDFNIASILLVFSIAFLLFGGIFGVYRWIEYAKMGDYASTGTVMLAALPIILGAQMLLGFIHFDITNIPKIPIQNRIKWDARVSHMELVK